MVRSYRSMALDTAEVLAMLDLARRAPSAGNASAVEYVVLDSPAEVGHYWDTTLPEPRRSEFAFPGLLRAPVLVIVTTRPQTYVERYAEDDKRHPELGASARGWTVPYWWVDAGAVAQNLLLLATARGIGACLFGLFEHEEAVAARFGIPDDRRCVATVAFGHPTEKPGPPGRSARRRRPPIDEICHWGRWGTPPPAAIISPARPTGSTPDPSADPK